MKETPYIRTKAQLKKLVKENVITFVLKVDLGDIYNCGIEGLNDLAQDHIEISGAYLSGMDYRVVGHVEGSSESEGAVLIEVEASTEEFEEGVL